MGSVVKAKRNQFTRDEQDAHLPPLQIVQDRNRTEEQKYIHGGTPRIQKSTVTEGTEEQCHQSSHLESTPKPQRNR